LVERSGATEQVMTKREYIENAVDVATRCKLFAEKTCRNWRDETPADTPYRDGLGEMRELYYSLQTVRHSAEVVLRRAKLIKT
jgi:hypothetical protein